MKPLSFLVFNLLFFFLSCPGYSQSKKPLKGAVPLWASATKYDYNKSPLEHDAEGGYFDVGFEQQVSLEQQSVYCKKAIRILTEAGIQNSSEISISFDPSYQQLIFHSIRIIRGNETIDQLNFSKLKTIQQETELNRFLYNGALSTILFLEDVRKGDVIEYSYTLKGFNPIFKGKYAAVYDMNFQVPVGNLYYKLVVPKGRQITVKNRNTDTKPVIQNNSNETIYEWKLNLVEPKRLPDNIPSWYDPYAIVQVSEYTSWKEVNDWAMNLFPFINDISPSLQKKIAEVRAQNSTTEKQILSALRFVQDDIRYMGIEMGEGSYKPGNPNKIFAQRFGDCKDKSYLLCTMLRSLGIQASPVFINTTYKKAITEWLPSPIAFDHVTVQVVLNNKTYWFDPTISFQRGSINLISYPDYHCGLVLSSSTNSLEKINVKEPGSVTIREIFDIPDMSGKAVLKVITKYSGSFADDMRSSFNNSSNYEMQKTFREYYANYYEDIIADSINYKDDELMGTFVTYEFYTIEELWELKDGIKKAFFDPFVIDGVLRKPKEIKRDMPFSLIWPANYKEEIEINLPEDWAAEESFESVNTSVVSMSAQFSHNSQKTIVLEYKYKNLKDHVTPADIKEYMDGLEKRENEFSYILSYSVDGRPLPNLSDKINNKSKSNSTIYISLLILFIIGGIVWWTQRR